MKQRHGAFSLLGAAAISTLALPVFANTDTQQTGTQSATIDGSNNQVIQVINQVNISHPGLGRGLGNNDRRGTVQGTVQDSSQSATVDGNGNSVYQETNQINQQRTSGRAEPGRGNGRGQQRGHDRDRDD
ncbi:hypothetical protein [Phormidium tenue]|uniref:Filamentous hemagglutinin n=1 Tax=Phormidium tenue NIES-30 TaxID=549789 RepID=A0A1U7J841_9CYAN|nr:hypothetical protein [Phormidium tenue]MBD2231228.1 hypothetical protein [Phormidium tenue FACHB-1052]OKH49476.1 hypothetical protein NIES30_06415 [Phormidium tenue NIES-30]